MITLTANKTSAAIHSVSATMSPTGRQPTANSALNEVFMPSAAIAATRQQRDTQKFAIRRDVPGFFRNRVAGADNLRDVVDRAANEDAGLSVVEADRGCEDRVDDHRDRRERGDAD